MECLRFEQPASAKAGLCHAGLTGFWKSAVSAADLPGPVPLERWDIDRAFSPQLPPSKMTMYTRFAAFCDGMPCFDAAAFRMTRPEATAIDPQQRLLMEECAGALEDAAAAQASIGYFTGDGVSKRAANITRLTRLHPQQQLSFTSPSLHDGKWHERS